MKKIVYVISELSYGGAQIMLLELLKKIHNNFNIKIVVKNYKLNNYLEEKIECLSNVKVVYINEQKNDNKLKKIKNFLKLKKEINSFNPDVVHCHLVETYSYLYALISKQKIVYTIHSWPDRILKKKINRELIIKNIKKNKIKFVGCAQSVSNCFEKLIDVPNSNKNYITTIYNPLDLGQFEKYNNIKKSANKEFVFTTVGRLSAIKNQKMLIDAFSKIANEKNCRLEIIGDGSLKKELEQRTRDLHIEKKVKFYGNISNDKVHDKIFNSNCFVLTSDSECCPMVLLESMALRTPIISTDVGGISEITKDSSLLVEKGNVDSLVKAMNRVINNPTFCNKIAMNGRKFVNQFDSSIIADKYLQLYLELFKNR